MKALNKREWNSMTMLLTKIYYISLSKILHLNNAPPLPFEMTFSSNIVAPTQL